MKAPIKEWEQQGLLTIVDEPVIQVHHIVDWFCEMREHYGLTRIVADTFRLDLVKTALENEGFEVVYIRNPKAASAKVAPKIETVFSNHQLIFGDNPLMRWYTNNVLVKIDKWGNKSYEKKDEIRRKTDGFMAMVYAFWEADNVLEEEIEFFIGDIKF
jgi:phage terminase large subunit-like protein